MKKLEQNKKIMYTCPRRFGKSMLANMLDYYYSIDKADETEDFELDKRLEQKDN